MAVPVPKFPELDGLKGRARDEAIRDLLRNSVVPGLDAVNFSGGEDEEYYEKGYSLFQKILLTLKLAKEVKSDD